MTHLEDTERASSCTGKVPYPSRGAAQRALKAQLKRRGNGPTQVYPCRFCEQWHLGHERSVRKGRNAR